MKISIFLLLFFLPRFSFADTTAFWNSILYDPVNFKNIDSNEARKQLENYLGKAWLKADLSYRTKKFNKKQLCIINNILDSLRGAATLTNCECDTVKNYKSLVESFAIISKWKNSSQIQKGRIAYRK